MTDSAPAEELHIRRRQLGTTDLQVSVIGIGSSPFRYASPQVCAELLTQAFDLGVNYYDTARSYLNGEEAVAAASKRVRDDLVVTTKTGARGGKYCLEDLQRSLKTTRRSWIDVWMTHLIESEKDYALCTELGGFCDIAAAAKQAGIVRASGASFHAHTDLILRAIEERAFDVVMFPLNVIGRETVFGSSIASYREQLLPAAQRNGVGVVVMKVLAAGEIRHGATKLPFLVQDSGSSSDISAGCIRWATMHPEIAVSVVGLASTDELVRTVLAVQGVTDSQRHVADAWFEAATALSSGPCTRCGACVGVCPEQIEIPKIFRLYDQHRYLGIRGFPARKYASLEIDGSACSRRGKCEDACPEDFDIADLLLDADRSLTCALGAT